EVHVPDYQTHYKRRKGRDLTRRVVRTLHLEAVPEFNGTAVQPQTPITILQNLQRRMLGLFLSGPAVQEAPQVDETSDESALVGAFVGRVSVDPVRGSRLVDVSFQSQDSKFSATAV